MTKQRKQISIDPEVADNIPEDVNFSDFVENCARQFYVEGRSDAVEAGMTSRMRDLIEERRRELISHVDDAFDELIATLDAIDETVAQPRHGESIDEAIDQCSNIVERRRTPENPLIIECAKHVGLSPEAFIDELNEQHPTDAAGNPVSHGGLVAE